MYARRLDQRAAFFRRPPILDAGGRDTGDRGPYALAFTVWANFRPESVREAVQGGAARNIETGTLTVRDSLQARTINNGDRVVLQGRDFVVDGVGLSDRRTGTIALSISSNLGGE